ncbi:MAG: Sorbitol operon regulator [Anaerolineae bacterium]|nr:Sorbitol operon regulator [Anaerolineae bacterium]
MATTADKNLLYKIARAYYEDNLTQGEIGSRFGLSRIKVSRLLQQARDEKVVQITILPPQNSNAELERHLEVLYNLNEVVVVSPSSYNSPILLQELGAAAADCLQRCLQGHEVVGFSWGNTLLSVVDHLTPQNWPEMKIVQVIGGLGRPEAEVHGTDLTRRTAQIFGAKPRMLASPGIVPNKLVRDALLTDPQISDTLELAARADVLLLGIGRPTGGSAVLQSGILTADELAELEGLGAVGDIALRFFDRHGCAIKHEINDRIVGLDLAQIKKAPRIIGAAGGEQKYEVIRAALAGGLINVLITDERTALKLKAEKEEVAAAASVN